MSPIPIVPLFSILCKFFFLNKTLVLPLHLKKKKNAFLDPNTHYYHNKRLQVNEFQYLILIYSWTLIPIPNWTCSIVTISPFDARFPSTWLTNCADLSMWLQSPTKEGCWLQSSLVHPHDNDQEDAWSQNPTMHIYSNFFRRDELGQNFVSDHNLLEQTILKTYATCVLFLRHLKQFFYMSRIRRKKVSKIHPRIPRFCTVAFTVFSSSRITSFILSNLQILIFKELVHCN